MKAARPAQALLVKLLAASALGGLVLPPAMIVLFGLLAGMLMYLHFLFPLVAVVTGVLAGRHIRSLWFYPLVNGFFTVYWVLRAGGYQLAVTAQYVGVYVLLGAVAMGLCACIRALLAARKNK